MSELALIYHPELRAQEFQRAAKQQRLVKIAKPKKQLRIPRIHASR